jgi:hypothetical protein
MHACCCSMATAIGVSTVTHCQLRCLCCCWCCCCPLLQVGYAAVKEVFGRTWRMSISAGQLGPVFTVRSDGCCCQLLLPFDVSHHCCLCTRCAVCCLLCSRHHLLVSYCITWVSGAHRRLLMRLLG